jgi:hypothetical protein
MKSLRYFTLWVFCTFFLASCSIAQLAFDTSDDIVNWRDWRITWITANKFSDVTVSLGNEKKTFLPEQEGFIFIAVQAEMINISNETQTMRFPQGPIYIKDNKEQLYDLVGLAQDNTILMAHPYLITESTMFITSTWNTTNYITIAYQPEVKEWFIEATSGAKFYVDFLFTVPENASGFVIQFGNNMTVVIE